MDVSLFILEQANTFFPINHNFYICNIGQFVNLANDLQKSATKNTTSL